MTSHPAPARSRAAFAVLAAAALCAALAAGVSLARPASQAGPWRRVMAGLWGDNVADFAFAGNPLINFRSYLLLTRGAGLARASVDLESWTPSIPNPARPDQIVHAIAPARDVEDGRTLYAGMQNVPLLARTADAGIGWTPLAGPAGPARIDILDVATSGRIYAGQAGGTDLWTSDDHGETWDLRAAPAGPLAPLDALVAAPDEAVLYLRSEGRLLRTADEPAQWDLVLAPTGLTTTLAVRTMAAGPRGRLYAVGRRDAAERFLASEDRGVTWVEGVWPGVGDAAPTALGAGEVAFGVSGAWIGFDDGRVFATTDNGVTWTPEATLPMPVTTLAVDPTAYTAFAGSDGLGLFRLGASPMQTGAYPADIRSLVVSTLHADGAGLLLGRITPQLQDVLGGTIPPVTVLYTTADRGETWARAAMTDGLGTELLPSTAFASDRRVFSGRWRSADGGGTWERLPPAPGSTAPHVVAVGPITATRPVLYGLAEPYADGTGGSGLSLSEDGGDTWTATDATVSGIVDLVVSPEFVNDRAAYFVTDRGAVFATDDGLSFTEVSRVRLIFGQGAVHDLAISPDFQLDRTMLLLVEDRSLPQRAQLYVSNTAGESWGTRNIGLAPLARLHALVLSPDFRNDRIVFLGTERQRGDPEWPAVYASDNAGLDWFAELFLDLGTVEAFAWSGSWSEGRVFAAAGRRGLWLRDLDGEPVEPVVTSTGTSTRTPTRTPSPTATPTGAASASPTPDPATATPTPTGGAETTATPTPSATPSGDPPTATATPDATATIAPTEPPTAAPATTEAPATPSATASATAIIDPPRALYIPFAQRSRAR